MPTRKEIREAAAELLGCLRRGTVSSATTTEVADPSLEDRFASLDLMQAWLETGGEVRRIVSYDPRSGKVALARALTNAPAPGASYAIYFRLHPEDWDEAVNRGLQRCSYLTRLSVMPVAGQEAYAISFAGEATVQPHQIEGVWLRRASGAYIDEWPVWFAAEPGQIRIRPLAVVDANTSLVVHVRRYYQPLASDSATTDAPLPLVRAAAAAEAALVMFERAPEAERPALQRLYAEALAEFQVQARRHIPPPRSTPQWDAPMREYGYYRAILPVD